MSAAFSEVKHPALEIIRRTAGLQSGYRTVQDVFDMFGVNVNNWPKLFQVTKTGLVVKLPLHEKLYQEHCQSVHRNWQALGVRN